MMAQPMGTRTQRRGEKKQLWMFSGILLAVALVSFVLGMLVGQRSRTQDGTIQEVHMPMATQIPVPKPPTAEATTEPPKLTFYDNLPQGSQAPLGSGINLPKKPPAAEPVPAPAVEPAKPSSPPAAAVTSRPAVEIKPATAAAATPAAVPAAVANGEFVVQIASFRLADDATKLRKRLAGLHIDSFVERADLGSKGVWHRVMAGPYADRGAADQVAERLKQEERLAAMVRRR